MIKVLVKVEMGGMYLNIIKTIYDKPVANIILNREKLKTFPIISRMRQGWQVFTQQLIVLEFLIRVIQQEEEIKGIQVGKEEVNFSYSQTT
jgi:hypothetical protein